MHWSAICTILALAAIEDLEIKSIDISNVCMCQPEGFEENTADWGCCQKKGLYGLKQSGTLWYQRLGEVLERLSS
ncbi:hypothetical protein FRC01_013557, partial [Tulasnella sp. 417]